jgi:hypothetical protein
MKASQVDGALLEARELAKRGVYEAAWDSIESLPLAARTSVPAFAVRLLICTGLQRWDVGMSIADLVEVSDAPEHREAAGRFYLAWAEFLCATGDREGAQLAVQSLFKIWPEGLDIAVQSTPLAVLWQ